MSTKSLMKLLHSSLQLTVSTSSIPAQSDLVPRLSSVVSSILLRKVPMQLFSFPHVPNMHYQMSWLQSSATQKMISQQLMIMPVLQPMSHQRLSRLILMVRNLVCPTCQFFSCYLTDFHLQQLPRKLGGPHCICSSSMMWLFRYTIAGSPTSLLALQQNAGVRQEVFDAFKTKLTSHWLQTSSIMQFAAGVRMLSMQS